MLGKDEEPQQLRATISKSYACFLFPIPKDYAGVAKITYRNGQLTLHERNAGPARDLSMHVGSAF